MRLRMMSSQIPSGTRIIRRRRESGLHPLMPIGMHALARDALETDPLLAPILVPTPAVVVGPGTIMAAAMQIAMHTVVHVMVALPAIAITQWQGLLLIPTNLSS